MLFRIKKPLIRIQSGFEQEDRPRGHETLVGPDFLRLRGVTRVPSNPADRTSRGLSPAGLRSRAENAEVARVPWPADSGGQTEKSGVTRVPWPEGRRPLTATRLYLN